MWSFIMKIISGVLGLWIAIEFIDGVSFLGTGLVMGVINVFIKPVLNLISLPLKILTLGLFGLIINIALVLAIDIFFPKLIITGILPLLWTTLIIWGIGVLIPGFKKN